MYLIADPVEEPNNQKSRAWGLLKHRLASVRVDDVLATDRIYVNRTKFTVLQEQDAVASKVIEALSTIFIIRVKDMSFHKESKNEFLHEFFFL